MIQNRIYEKRSFVSNDYLLLEISTSPRRSWRARWRSPSARSIATWWRSPLRAFQSTHRRERTAGSRCCRTTRFDKALLSDDEQNQILFAIQSLRAAEQPVDALLSKLGVLVQKETQTGSRWTFSRWGIVQDGHEKV
jgi:hypothetical protein